MQPSNPTRRPTLSSRLSRTVPQYIVRLTHEPSIGLHFVVRHAQSRTAPALTGISQVLRRRSREISIAVIDATDACAILGEDMTKASETLQRIDNVLKNVLQEDRA
ncbi:unnamed protein product [Agarophyton chilense]